MHGVYFVSAKGKLVEKQGRKVTGLKLENHDSRTAWDTKVFWGGIGMKKESLEGLDLEWVELMKEALEMGVSAEDVRKFLREAEASMNV